MGITIHYRGKIDDVSKVQQLTQTLRDFARDLGWKFHIMDEDWSLPNTAVLHGGIKGARITGHAPLKGIILTPHPDCESLDITFDKKGHLVDIVGMCLLNEGTTTLRKLTLFTKTQFAPFAIHVGIVKLLRYLKGTYISNLEVMDEGGYWESDDVRALVKRIGFVSSKLDKMKSALNAETIDQKIMSSPEMIADWVESKLVRHFGENHA